MFEHALWDAGFQEETLLGTYGAFRQLMNVVKELCTQMADENINTGKNKYATLTSTQPLEMQ